MLLNRVGKEKALRDSPTDGDGSSTAKPGEQFQIPYWVDAQYVYMVTMPDIKDAYPAGILRMARSALGNPTVPPF